MDKNREALSAAAVMPTMTVKDIEASLKWYTEVLGCVVETRLESEGKLAGVAVRAGSVHFVLGQDDGAKGWDRVKGVGNRFLCITNQDADRLAEGIKARGGVLDQEPTDVPRGSRDFSIVDPDGFNITTSNRQAP